MVVVICTINTSIVIMSTVGALWWSLSACPLVYYSYIDSPWPCCCRKMPPSVVAGPVVAPPGQTVLERSTADYYDSSNVQNVLQRVAAFLKSFCVAFAPALNGLAVGGVDSASVRRWQHVARAYFSCFIFQLFLKQKCLPRKGVTNCYRNRR